MQQVYIPISFPTPWESIQFSSVQSLSRVRFFATPWSAAHQASLSITNSRSSLRLTFIKSVIPSTHSSSVVPFSSCPQSLPASESFPVSLSELRELVMDREVWRAEIHGVAKSWTRLSNWTELKVLWVLGIYGIYCDMWDAVDNWNSLTEINYRV